ncbi:hypothetical protein ACOME3_001328 [Neoechinorhynchus agilis]
MSTNITIMDDVPADYMSQVEMLLSLFSCAECPFKIDGNAINIDLTVQSTNYEVPCSMMMMMPWMELDAYNYLTNLLISLKLNLMSTSTLSPVCYLLNFYKDLMQVGIGDLDGLKSAVSLLQFRNIIPSERYFYCTIVPKMVDVALEGAALFGPGKRIPSLYPASNIALTLSARQCLCLLTHAFFNTLNDETHYLCEGFRRNANHLSLLKLLSESYLSNKLASILDYFVYQIENPDKLNYSITFYRANLTNGNREFDVQNMVSRCELIAKVLLTSDALIERFVSCVQIDFANRNIGGGVLRSGCVQEEIMFCRAPELLTSILFNFPMTDNECIHITGARKFASTLGQYAKSKIDREIIKAVCGFMTSPKFQNNPVNAVATGNWGCGAFGSDVDLKFLIQVIAASICRRNIVYCTFHDNHLANRITVFYRKLQRIPLKKIYDCLIEKAKTIGETDSLLDSISSSLH